ncbi:MAG: acyl-CoA dehydrogenase family protein [Deltaproteobacteria bacterium]|nr:acyl-CoA dehydrogenase family protein [Deltaproteobacteria bacterium]
MTPKIANPNKPVATMPDAKALESYAREHVAPDVIARESNPAAVRGILRDLGEQGWLKLPRSRGECLGLLDGINAFVRGGKDLGAALSWIATVANVTWPIRDHVISHALEMALGDLQSGRWIGGFAATETGVGVDPNQMKTRADKFKASFRLNGEKHYVTNGAVADVVLVLAVTSRDTAEQGVSAFMIPTSREGMKITPFEKAPVLPTSPAGKLAMNHVAAVDEEMVGTIGQALQLVSRRVFWRERTLVLSALIAHLHNLAELIARAQVREIDREMLFQLDLLRAALASLAPPILTTGACDYNARPAFIGLFKGVGRVAAELLRLAPQFGFNEPIQRHVRDCGILEVDRKAVKRIEQRLGPIPAPWSYAAGATEETSPSGGPGDRTTPPATLDLSRRRS